MCAEAKEDGAKLPANVVVVVFLSPVLDEEPELTALTTVPDAAIVVEVAELVDEELEMTAETAVPDLAKVAAAIVLFSNGKGVAVVLAVVVVVWCFGCFECWWCIIDVVVTVTVTCCVTVTNIGESQAPETPAALIAVPVCVEVPPTLTAAPVLDETIEGWVFIVASVGLAIVEIGMRLPLGPGVKSTNMVDVLVTETTVVTSLVLFP